MKSPKLEGFIEFVLDNLFDMITVVAAGYIVTRHQITPFTPSDIGTLATWILAIMGLLAVSGLWERNRKLRRIENLAEQGRDLVLRRISREVSASEFLTTERRVSSDTFASADVILLAGITLTRTTREYMHVLGQRLVSGAHIRTVSIDPALPSVMEVMAARSMGDTTAEYWSTRMQTVGTVIEAIANTPGSKGSLEVGHLPYIPSFGLIMIDPDQDHGVCFVELYHHKTAELNPSFVLKASRDPFWFKFFRNQYEVLWDSCRVERFPAE